VSARVHPARRPLIRRVWELRARGLSEGQIAYKLGVPKPTVHRWLAKRAVAGYAA
jgi:orotate phosphoribosyltransferase-like protein